MSSKKRASLSSNSPLDQLFGPTAPREDVETREQEAAPPSAQPQQAPAPPVQEPPSLRQTTIMIYEDQSNWLDEVCYLAKREGGSNVSKAAIIRALVDLAREHEVDLAGSESDEEIKVRLQETFGLR